METGAARQGAASLGAQNVELVGQIGGPTCAVALQGDYAYIGVGPRLVILNVADPAHPTAVGQTGVLPNVVRGVAVAGSYAYVADGEGGLRVINVADPAHPGEAGFYDTLGSAWGVALAGSYAYVADGEGGLLILRFTGGGLTYSISGRVTETGGSPIQGVTITVSSGMTVTTTAGGYYTITALITGTYTLTPSKGGYTFLPPSRTVSVPPDATGQDFVGSVAMPTRKEMPFWRTLLLVYHSIDTDYTDSSGLPCHLTYTMPLTEVLDGLKAFQQYASIAHDFSNAEALVKYDVMHITRPITSLTAMGTNLYWASPSDTRQELDLYAPTGAYDSVLVLWPQTNFSTGQQIPSGGWGLAILPSAWSNEATYGTVANAPTWMWDIATVGEPWLHEWLHSLCSYYTDKGYAMPQLCADGGSSHGYIASASDGLAAFYRDLMTGRVLENGTPAGITAEAWRSGAIWDRRAQVFADYFYTDTTASYVKTGAVSWQNTPARMQHIALGNSQPADNKMYAAFNSRSNYTVTGRLYIPSSGVGRWDSVAVALRDGQAEYWASLLYGTDLTEGNCIDIMRNDTHGTPYPLILTPGWYTIKVSVDNATGVMRMKAWVDGDNEPTSWQASRTLDADWAATQIGFRHYGQGTDVDDLVVVENLAPVAPTRIAVNGPTTGVVGSNYTFSAVVTPVSTTLPITYTWQATGQTPVTHTAGLSDTVAFSWSTAGTKMITVTATNAGGTVTDTRQVAITAPSFGPPTRWIANYGTVVGGWTSQDKYPRAVADVDADGRADIVGFGGAGVYVSLATSSNTFSAPVLWIRAFGASSSAGGWTSQDLYPRLVADVNGDGRADVVGFGKYGTYVSLSTGTSFAPVTRWIANYGTVVGGWTSQDKYPRALADVNKDGRADVVGFGNAGVYVSLATSSNTFAPPALWIRAFGAAAGGWTSQTLFPRLVADVDGDGRADVVGFSKYGAYVSLSTGTSFLPATRWIANYGTVVGGWTSQNLLPRMLADVNGDGKADIAGFGNVGAFVSLSTGGSFSPPVLGIAAFGRIPAAGGWTSQNLYPRTLGDVNHDHKADIIGFGTAGAFVSLAQ
jgi:hypothetical protein